MHLALLQYGVEPLADIRAWEAKLDRLVAEAAGDGAEFLVMPEYAALEAAAAGATHPDLKAELARACDLTPELLHAMRNAALRHRVWLVPGSLPVRLGGKVINRAPIIAPDGRIAFQDKRCMTRFEAEEWHVDAGNSSGVVETDWGRIGVTICYDVEFPTLVRAQVTAGARLILVPSCTDTLAGFHRVTLSARARALENQCYVAVAPTVGEAPHCAALDVSRGRAMLFGPVDGLFPDDGIIAGGRMDTPGWVHATLDFTLLHSVRERGAVRNHRDWPDAVPPAPLLMMQ